MKGHILPVNAVFLQAQMGNDQPGKQQAEDPDDPFDDGFL